MIPDLSQAPLLDPTVVSSMARLGQHEDAAIARTATLAIVGEALARLGALAEREHIAASFYALSGVAIELVRLDQAAEVGKLADRERHRRHVAASVAKIAESVLRAGGRA